MSSSNAKRILIIATDHFEESELLEPKQALERAGHTVKVASPQTKPIQGEKKGKPTKTVTPDLTLQQAHGEEFDALVVPGGVGNPDALRLDSDAVGLVKVFMEQKKPVAAICHGPWLLVEANVVKGRTLTAWPSVRTDLKNAGADVVDEAVVVDDNLITSRKPDDLPQFNQALLQALAATAPKTTATATKAAPPASPAPPASAPR
jgi:protease I